MTAYQFALDHKIQTQTPRELDGKTWLVHVEYNIDSQQWEL